MIKACLNAIDQHVALYLNTREEWHLEQAERLRCYVSDLKRWIHQQEGKN